MKTYELTNPQKSIWLSEQYYKGTNINNICGVLSIHENVNFDILEKALNLLVEKNDGLRMKFLMENNTVKQTIMPYTHISINIIDIESEEELNKISHDISYRVFNVFKYPLFTFTMFRLKDNSGGFITCLHHLISDAWTLSLCLNEVLSYYYSLINNIEISSINNPSYLEYIESEKKYLESDKFLKDKEYWQTHFNQLPEIQSFKTGISSSSSSRKSCNINADILNKINNFCKENKISQYIFFLGIFSIYFKNLFNSNQFIIGNPILNRSNFTEKNITGLFVTTHPFLFDINDNYTFIEHCEKISLDQKNMYRHLKYPYQLTIEYIRKKHHITSNLYDIIISYQNAKANNNAKNINFSSKWIPANNQNESLMIHLRDTDNTGNISIDYDYLKDIFSDNDIDRLHQRILYIANQILENKNIKICNIEIVPKNEFNYLFCHLNDNKLAIPNTSIINMFEKQVNQTPNNIAVSSHDGSLTYHDLNNYSNFIANNLLELGVKKGDIVAVMLHRSTKIIPSILGVLKTGACYVPIDPEYPVERIEYMLKHSSAKAIVGTSDCLNILDSSASTICLDNLSFNNNKIYENPNIEITSDSLAYIIYTSGSTGNPKAVSIRHENVINFCMSMREKLDYSAKNNVVLSVTTMCFDIFVFEIFPTLLFGLKLVIANELEARTPELLSSVIENEHITKILTTPSRIELLFLDTKYSDCLSNLKEIILGGEPFPIELLHKLQYVTSARIYNLYGPTETTVYSAFKELTNETEITIGKPIHNTSIYILNDNNKILPINSIGEICIGGYGVGNGYYGNSELTNKVFIKNPYISNEIIYKTGDLGKWTKNNELVCFGRKDFQIKIRGYRIELGDINSNILKYPHIKHSFVTNKKDANGNDILCAYIVSDEKIHIGSLHEYLSGILPTYMVPNYIMQISSLPLTLNHKVDRKALPDPIFEYAESSTYIKPTTETEKILCNIIASELNVKKIGIDTDIFDYPIDSLMIIKFQTKLIPYNFNLITQDFYKYRTIRKLANYLDDNINNTKSQKADDLYNIRNKMRKTDNNISLLNSPRKYETILLTGATGYLGMHVLKELLENTNSKILCLVRKKDGIKVLNRIYELYEFYFNKTPCAERLTVLEADVTHNLFELPLLEYNNILNNTDLVINTVANVRYYGDYDIFKSTNVDSVKELIKFCLKGNIPLIHISTLGVSGNYLVKQDNDLSTFTENDFYIGQHYTENVYIRTKFEAECEIYKNIENGLKASIMRVGNLTGRYSDGHFQKNIENNSFYNILRTVLTFKIVPKQMSDQSLEFTPVDLCAKSLVSLILNADIENKVFHLFNHNLISFFDLITYFIDLGYDIKLINGDKYIKQIIDLSSDNKNSNILKGIVNDLDTKKGLSFRANVIQKNHITNEYLKQLNLKWPIIDKNYIEKIIRYIENKKYISKETN